jgi:hypothetical protein
MIITGERFEYLCDHILGTNDNFSFSPKDVVKLHPEKIIHLDSFIKPLDNKYKVFCYQNWFHKDFDFLISKLKLLQNKFILIMHNCDESIDEKHMIIFERVENLEKIFTVNVNVKHEKVIPIPIGLSNKQWEYGDEAALLDIMSKNNTKEFFLYFYFSIGTNPSKRQECYNKIHAKGYNFQPRRNFKNNLDTLSRHKFCISPDGNGIDCHRTWESLWLKVVPICTYSPHIEHFKNLGLPIIIINDWNELDLDNLEKEYDKINWDEIQHLLQFEYYSNLINSNS